MKKQLLLILMSVSLVCVMCTGCGNKNENAEGTVIVDADSALDNIEVTPADSTSADEEAATDDANNSSATDISADTIGGKYLIAFNQTELDDPAQIADQLILGVDNEMDLVAMDVVPGYLNGFDNEISGFSKGTMFSPMIGSIPFVGYVFISDDPSALEAALKESANLRWNICTEADEMVSATKGNLVFFMMCTNEN